MLLAGLSCLGSYGGPAHWTRRWTPPWWAVVRTIDTNGRAPDGARPKFSKHRKARTAEAALAPAQIRYSAALA
jgi:hypothetical protein